MHPCDLECTGGQAHGQAEEEGQVCLALEHATGEEVLRPCNAVHVTFAVLEFVHPQGRERRRGVVWVRPQVCQRAVKGQAATIALFVQPPPPTSPTHDRRTVTTSVHVYVCRHDGVCMYVCMRMCLYADVCMHVSVCVYMCVCVCVRVSI
jgi:hypothetical protein